VEKGATNGSVLQATSASGLEVCVHRWRGGGADQQEGSKDNVLQVALAGWNKVIIHSGRREQMGIDLTENMFAEHG
jgi:hypothetical protein